jgi:HPt (histidine-containing phosphotransfer) domain-containing protein
LWAVLRFVHGIAIASSAIQEELKVSSQIVAVGQSIAAPPRLPHRKAGEVPSEVESSDRAARVSSNGAAPKPESISESANDLADVCDRATLNELRAEGDNLLPELVGIFQIELGKGLDQLTQALAARDCIAVARIAHTLKGTAGNFGAKQMHEMAARMDQIARAGHAEQATAMFEDFRWECERVRRFLAAEVKA